MKIVYVCTNYNNSDFTLTAVDSLMRNINHEIEVYVVDNASNEEAVKKLRSLSQKYPFVHIIENQNNIGYFAGLNIGIMAARKADPRIAWMIVGNNDLEFPADFCDCIELRCAEYQEYAVVSPDVVTLDGEHQNPHVIAKISMFREIIYDIYYSNYWVGLFIYKISKLLPRITRRGDEDNWHTAQPIYSGHGSCYLLTPKFFSKFEVFWAPTFMMAEEAFLSLQLKEAGQQILYSPDISVTHHWHGSLQTMSSQSRWNLSRVAHREYRKYIKVFRNSESK